MLIKSRAVQVYGHSWINQPRTVAHTIGVHYLIGSVISQSQPHRSTASRHVTFTAVIHYFLLNENTTISKDAALLWTFWCCCWMMLLLINECLNLIFLVLFLLLNQFLMQNFLLFYFWIKLCACHLKDATENLIPKLFNFNQFKSITYLNLIITVW